jgi:hypothetical protein
MLTTSLPNGRSTGQLAFGCGGIGGALNYADSKKLLIAAWDAGFRHFDVAPSYGLGMAEAYLGRFLKEVGPRDATLTTKAGIRAAGGSAALTSAIKHIARPFLNQVPTLRRKLGERMRSAAARGLFAPDDIRASIDQSMRALGVEHIDVLLMHELCAGDLSEELTTILNDAVRAGKIGSFGVGSRREDAAELSITLPDSFHYFQTSWELDFPILPKPAHGVSNCHGVLRQRQMLDTRLLQKQQLVEEVAHVTGIDLRDNQGKLDLLLGMALADVGEGLVIVQSSKPSRIRQLRVDDRYVDIVDIGRLGNAVLERN